MDSHVSAFPSLAPGTLLRRPGPRTPSWEVEGTFTSSARAAAYRAVRRFGISSPATVLVPSYHCGVEIEAVLRAGAAIEYYPVPRGMTFDPEEVVPLLKPHVRALFLIHYWGFPQEAARLAGICRERNVLLIEDCAHALFSRAGSAPLGSFGDAALFSLPKSLPVPDGGVLRIRRCLERNGAAAADPPPRRGPGAVAWKAAARSVLESFRGGRNRLLSRCADGLLEARRARAGTTPPRLEHYGETTLALYDRGISPISRYVLQRSRPEEIVRRRRANYLRLRQALIGTVATPFPSLPAGTCPLFLPVVIEDRDGLEAALRRERIESFVFGRTLHPTLDREAYPEAVFLSGHLLGLPIHQDLEPEDIERIARKTRDWLGR